MDFWSIDFVIVQNNDDFINWFQSVYFLVSKLVLYSRISLCVQILSKDRSHLRTTYIFQSRISAYHLRCKHSSPRRTRPYSDLRIVMLHQHGKSNHRAAFFTTRDLLAKYDHQSITTLPASHWLRQLTYCHSMSLSKQKPVQLLTYL